MDSIEREVTQSMFKIRENGSDHPTYYSEMSFYSLVAEGKLEEVRERYKTAPASDAAVRGILSDDPWRNTMYHYVVLTTLICRACISHGMPQDIAYNLSDIFIRRADALQRIADIKKLESEMVETYCKYMVEENARPAKSKQITECLDYIRANIHRNMTVSELANHIKLNETYLSKLFKKEMGCSVSEYIRNEKVTEARWLLAYTDKTSIEIATDLSFSSHSYFISVFKKVTGKTPKEYRNENFRKLV